MSIRTEIASGGGYFRHNDEDASMAGLDKSWVFASGVAGLTRCVVPVQGKQDKPAKYAVTLYFADMDNDKAGKRVFDVKLQGKKVAERLDIVKEAPNGHNAVVRRFENVQVGEGLEIELVPNGTGSSGAGGPVLCGVELEKSDAGS